MRISLRWVYLLGLLTLIFGARAFQSLAMPSHTPQGTTRVAIVKVQSNVEEAVREAVRLAGGLEGIIKPGDLVVVKPNLVMDAPAGSGMVTDPVVTRVMVRIAFEAGAREVIIAEGTAQYSQGDPNRDRFCTQAAFRVAGYDLDSDMKDDVTGVPLVDLNDSGGTDAADPSKVTRVVIPAGLIRKEYWLPNLILRADVLISVPVLKNHFLAGVTLGMKNMIGALPNDLYHAPGCIFGKHSLSHIPVELDRHIVDINLARKPDFVVVDGQRGMIDGPIGSKIIEPPMGLIIAGQDVVAVDTIGALVMGYDPSSIPYIQMAAQSGLGIADTARIRVVGMPVVQVRRDFPAPYGDSLARRADSEPPKVAINAPNRVLLPKKFRVKVEASDNETIARVELYLGRKWIGSLLAPPYEFEIESSQYSPGKHTLQAIAYDRCLNQAWSSQEVFLLPPAPTETFTPTPLPPTDTPSPTSTPFPTPTPVEITPKFPSPLPTASPVPATPTPAVPVSVQTEVMPWYLNIFCLLSMAVLGICLAVFFTLSRRK
ncbi:MAG: DUF362 domain-containing protein [Anaerolineae bacterium]|nr:DUF362 domain-containing protein [Anaerolineae bacterium]MDW8102444.1 DUF362 domain-containing protein [Anaerolineae bacterium]